MGGRRRWGGEGIRQMGVPELGRVLPPTHCQPIPLSHSLIFLTPTFSLLYLIRKVKDFEPFFYILKDMVAPLHSFYIFKDFVASCHSFLHS